MSATASTSQGLGQTTDLAAKNPEVVSNLKIKLKNWQRSANASLTGLDKKEKPVVTINGEKTHFKKSASDM